MANPAKRDPMSKHSKLAARFVLVIMLAAQFYGFLFLFPKQLESANLTSVSDTLSNSRLSFRGEVEGAHVAGSSIIALDSTPENSVNTSSGSASLMGNESIQVGTNNGPNIVKTIESDTRIVLSAGITNAVNDGVPIFATVSAIHTVRFTPVSAINGGAVRALIPASSTNNNDGIPDRNGFDFPNAGAPTVSCIGGGSNFTFQTGTATASAIQIPASTGTWYHSFECRYNGSGASPSEVTMIIGTPTGNKLINPSPASTTRFPGQADTYNFRVRHTEGIVGSYTTVDESLGTLAVVEAVRVTATVAPILTFTITEITADSGSYCGVTRTANSPDSSTRSVPFGTVVSTAFTDADQLLTVSTNAAGGYSVTASESANLTAWNITGTPTIPDTTCDSGCTVSTTAPWTLPANKGFGYALQDVTGDAVLDTIEYTTGYRPFSPTAQQIMRANPAGPVDADQAYVCYRIVVSGSQQAGDYESYIIYIATATF